MLEDWNANQGEEKGKVFIPVKPTNDQCPMPEVDVLIGIVGSFISDQEFFKAYVDAGKKVLLFFNTVHDADSTINSEVQEEEEFKEQMKPLCSYIDFNGIARFADSLFGRLFTI